jgi:PhnB protein
MQVTFEAQGTQTLVHIHSISESPEQLELVIKTFGADKGLKENMDKLERYMRAQQQLRQQLKTIPMARVCTYLNFPGNTEEAFLFYKSVFGGEFAGGGITRLGDGPQPEGIPPLSEEDKNLVLHVELPILGGHVLMATDAPESMGFTLVNGNNMHINLEPETRNETRRLFDALAAGGKVTMELQDMFFGAYYGSCTDKYNINWMFTCHEKA